MTTATTTIQRAAPKSGATRFGRMCTVLAAIGDRIAGWSDPYNVGGIRHELDLTPPSERIGAALRWHAQDGRVL